MEDSRTPLARARGLGSAKEGVHHWWAQRLTAVALVPLLLWFVWSVGAMPDLSYDSATAWVAEPWHAVLLLILVPVVSYHSYLGVTVVIEDYVRPDGAKLALIVLLRFVAVFFGFAAVVAILRIGFGG